MPCEAGKGIVHTKQTHEISAKLQQKGQHRAGSSVHIPLSEKPFVQESRRFNRHSGRQQIADPGNNLRTAFRVPAFTGQRDFTNTVSLNDRDFYRLKLPQRRIIKATATNFSDNSLSIAILGRQGVRVFDQDDVVSTGQKSQLNQF